MSEQKKTTSPTADAKCESATTRRKFLRTGAAAAAGAATIGFPMVSRAETTTLKMQGAWGAKDIFNEMALEYVKRVNEMSGGRLKIEYLNSDTVSHNIHTYAVKNEGLNKTVSAGTTISQEFKKAEQVKVACDIHPWMTSYIFVTDATVWSTTGEDGSFILDGVPAGSYRLSIRSAGHLHEEEADLVLADGEVRGGVLRRLSDALYNLNLLTHPRDFSALHRQLIKRGLAVKLGDPFPARPSQVPDEVPRVVARIRALMRQ